MEFGFCFWLSAFSFSFEGDGAGGAGAAADGVFGGAATDADDRDERAGNSVADSTADQWARATAAAMGPDTVSSASALSVVVWGRDTGAAGAELQDGY